MADETEQGTPAGEPVVDKPVVAEAKPVAEETPAPSVADGLTLGQGAPADDEIVGAAYAPMVRGKIDRTGAAIGTGRRKTAVARVRVKDGTGDLTINGRALDDYFKTDRDRQMILGPLKATDSLGKVNVWVRVEGGGTTGQTGAIVLGIARALQVRDHALHTTLSSGGYLTRDSRMVERKKYGFKKARRSFQFSKR